MVNNTRDIDEIYSFPNVNTETDTYDINNNNVINKNNQLKSSAHSFLFNNNSNINSNIKNSFTSNLASIENKYNNIESQNMIENPLNYLSDNQSKNNMKKMDIKEIYKSVSTFNKANTQARKRWPGTGSRNSTVNYRHFREGNHEIMVYNNGFKIIKYEDQPNVTF